MQRGLIGVTQEPGGTAYWHRSKLVTMAGKTGTANRIDENCHCYRGYTASFIGMVPADHPRLVGLCAVKGTPMFGGEAAAPAVQQIMQYSLQRLEIAP